MIPSLQKMRSQTKSDEGRLLISEIKDKGTRNARGVKLCFLFQKYPYNPSESLQLSWKTTKRRLRTISFLWDLKLEIICFNFPSFPVIFGLVITNLILGAATNENDDLVSRVHFFLEIFMIVFFIVEFCVRLWSVRADAKYRTRYGKSLKYSLLNFITWGRIYYLFHTVTIIDLFIIPATILLLVFKGHDVDGATLDTLRFIQVSSIQTHFSFGHSRRKR